MTPCAHLVSRLAVSIPNIFLDGGATVVVSTVCSAVHSVDAVVVVDVAVGSHAAMVSGDPEL